MVVEELLPEVYYKESRDFSYIGRLLEIIINYAKTQSELIRTDFYNENVDKNLLALLAKTVGFETKHEYLNKDLLLVVRNFNNLVRQKGTEESIRDALKLIAVSQGLVIADEDRLVDLHDDDKSLSITAPYGMQDIVLFEDLLTYILPAGWIYEIIFADAADTADDDLKTIVSYTEGSQAGAYTYPGDQLGRVYGGYSYEDAEGAIKIAIDTDTVDNPPTIESGSTTPKARATWYTGQVYTKDYPTSNSSGPEESDAEESSRQLV